MPRGPSLSVFLRSLDLRREDETPDLAWLHESYLAPGPFRSLLDEHARKVAPPALRSRSGVAVDLYDDAVDRHAGTDRVALRHYDRRAGALRELSYAELAVRASIVASAWAAEGISPSDPIAILLPLGSDYLVAFAAALRLGACPAFLPPCYDRLLAGRLAAIKPKRVVIDPTKTPPLGKFADLAIDLDPRGRAEMTPPASFAPGDPCAFIVSPVRAPLGTPTPLPAELALENALRDAFVAFRLAPGRAIAAPGLHPEQHFPALLLASLLAGATFVHLDINDLARDLSLLTASPIHALIVPEALCALWRARPTGPPPGLEHWLRPADEALDWTAYHDLLEKNELAQIPGSNFLADAASGGCLLFSTRRANSPSARVLPCPGRPYALADVASGEIASADRGLFFLLPSKKPLEDGWFIIARQGAEYLYGSTRLPRRSARIFPEAEVVELLAEISFVVGTCVAAVPASPGARFDFHLVVFTGARPGEDPDALVNERRAIIEQAIAEHLGPDAQPDRIELVALWPRRKGKNVDAAACRAQYLAGRLKRKACAPSIQRLSELRGAMLDHVRPPGS